MLLFLDEQFATAQSIKQRYYQLAWLLFAWLAWNSFSWFFLDVWHFFREGLCSEFFGATYCQIAEVR